jgi:D-alanyl-D-alanine endopeptidase (penicillin-binding protein 7)
MKSLFIALTLSLLFTGTATAARKPRAKAVPIIPAFSTQSYIVATSEGTIIDEKDSDSIRSIASISKLMVALLASEQDLSESLQIPSKREVHTSIPKKVGSLSRNELLELALVKSDNLAAQVLCINLPDCVVKMNDKALELGMFNTKYVEPTGLDRENVSTAHDLLKLALVAMSNPVIQSLSSMPQAEIYTNGKSIKINNTNPLTSKLDVIISKTGFTKPAGGCLLMVVNSELGQRVLILLGSKNSHTRVPDAEKLIRQ